MARFCVVELPDHFDAPIVFTVLGNGEPEHRVRDFRYVQTGYMAAPHYHADLYNAQDDDDPTETIPAFGRISILNPERFEPDLSIRPALHPQRAPLSAWLTEAAKSPTAPWVRHLPIFIRATIRDMAGPSSKTGASVLIPDHAVATVTGDNGAMMASGFHDAALVPAQVLDRNEQAIDPPLAPLTLVGASDDPRRGFVTRLEAALADIVLAKDDASVGFSPASFKRAFGKRIDELATEEDRIGGIYVFPLIVAEYVAHDDLFIFCTVTVSVYTDPSVAHLRCYHHARGMLPAERLRPSFSDFVVDEIGKGTMDDAVWSRLTAAAGMNMTPIIAFDDDGTLISDSDARLSGIRSETTSLITNGTEIDLTRGLIKKAIFDLRGEQEGSSPVDPMLSAEWVRRPYGKPEGAYEKVKVARNHKTPGEQDGTQAVSETSPAVTDTILQEIGRGAQSPDTAPQAAGTESAQAVDTDTAPQADDEDIDTVVQTGAGQGDAPAEIEGGSITTGDYEDIDIDPKTERAEGDSQEDQEGEGDQTGGSDDGAGSLRDLKPEQEPREKETAQEATNTPVPSTGIAASSTTVRRNRDEDNDKDDETRLPDSSILKQIMLNEAHLRVLKDCASKSNQIEKKDIDALHQPNDRHMAILNTYLTMGITPEDYVRANQDDMEPHHHSDVVYVQERWHRNAAVRALALIMVDKSLPKDWNLDTKLLNPARMVLHMKRAEIAVSEAVARLGPDAGGGNGP